MRTIRLSDRSRDKLLHIEAPGCIVNVRVGLTDGAGRTVTRVDVVADGDRYAGEPAWWADGTTSKTGAAVRVIQAKGGTA